MKRNILILCFLCSLFLYLSSFSHPYSSQGLYLEEANCTCEYIVINQKTIDLEGKEAEVDKSVISSLCMLSTESNEFHLSSKDMLLMLVLLCGPLMIFFLILVIRTRKTKVDSHYRGVQMCYLMEFCSTFLMLVFGVIGIYYPMPAIYFVGVAYLIFAIFLIVENVKLHHSSIGLMIAFLFEVLFFLITLLDDSVTLASCELACGVSLIFGYIFSVIMLIKLFSLHQKLNRNKNGIVSIPLQDPKNKYYPIGYLSRKWVVVLWSLFAGWLCLFATVLGVLLYFDQPTILTSILLFVGFVIVLIIYVIILNLSNTKEFRTYVKDLDYKKMETSILKRISDPKINPETVNYYKMRLAVYCSAVSLERYNHLKQEIFIPENKAYRLEYEMNKVNYLLTKKELNDAIEKLIQLYPTASVRKRAEQFANVWEAYYTGNCVGAIDNIAPYQTKNQFLNGMNLFIQIHYYKNKNLDEKSEELKKKFLKEFSQLTLLADILLGKEVIMNLKEERTCKVCGTVVKDQDLYCSTCGALLEEKDHAAD